MSNREHMLCLAAATALVAFSGVARADDYSIPNTEQFARTEEAQPMTCAQATAFAWFLRQLELPDGGNGGAIPTPAECERTHVATGAAQGDREVYEESK